jgi:hypothetical protein
MWHAMLDLMYGMACFAYTPSSVYTALVTQHYNQRVHVCGQQCIDFDRMDTLTACSWCCAW